MQANEEQHHVHVGLSVIHGKGLFASRDFEAGEMIGIYHGEIVEEDGMHVLWVEEDDDHWVGYDGTGLLRYMNHSEQPNAEMDGLECYATRDIRQGEEITIDYGW